MLSRWRAVRLGLRGGRRAAHTSSSSVSDTIVRSVRELVEDPSPTTPSPPSSALQSADRTPTTPSSPSSWPSSSPSSALSAADLRSLLARHSTGAALPSEIASVLRASYDGLDNPAARLRFFRMLSEGFGLRGDGGDSGGSDDGGGVSAAYAAFERVRSSAKRVGGGGSSSGDGGKSAAAPGGGEGGGAHDAAALARCAARLRAALTPPYMRLLLPVAQEPGGIAWIVSLRGDLLALLRGEAGGDGREGVGPPDATGAVAAATDSAAPPPSAAAAVAVPASCAPALRALAEDLRSALSDFFAPGLLRLRALSWATTPAALLDRAARADRVHPMRSLEDLRLRLDRPDRRVFAFERDGDPLVVLHAALFPAEGAGDDPDAAADAAVPSRLDQILGPPPPATTTTGQSPPPPVVACFYSISVALPGLAGVDLGNLLIKRAAASLAAEFPSLRRLATLSPMPLLRATVEQRLSLLSSSSSSCNPEAQAPAVAALSCLLASGDVAERLARARDALGLERGPIARGGGGVSPSAVSRGAAADLLALFGGGGKQGGGNRDDKDPWLSRAHEHGDPALFDQVLLPRLAALYLALERRRGLALDPVAAFHLRNGAVAWRVVPLADRRRGSQGLSASYGVLVNFLYEPGRLSERNRRYLVERQVALGPMVEALLVPPPL